MAGDGSKDDDHHHEHSDGCCGGNHDHDHDEGHTKKSKSGFSRRGFLGAAGLTAAGLGFNTLAPSGAEAAHFKRRHGKCPTWGKNDRVLLKGGVVVTMDPKIGDFEKADVLIQGKKIIAVQPNIKASAKVVDCSGMIVMPGFITTHHHQYQTMMRSIIADGYITFADNPPQPEQQSTAWNYEAYTTVVQSIWTAGRIGPASAPLWDLGAPPIHPEDCYIAELVCSLAQITQGVERAFVLMGVHFHCKLIARCGLGQPRREVEGHASLGDRGVPRGLGACGSECRCHLLVLSEEG